MRDGYRARSQASAAAVARVWAYRAGAGHDDGDFEKWKNECHGHVVSPHQRNEERQKEGHPSLQAHASARQTLTAQRIIVLATAWRWS